MSEKSAYMEMLRILPYLTVLHVVPFRIAEARLEVLSDITKRLVFLQVKPGFNIVESYRMLDLEVIVGILSFRRKAHEREGRDMAPEEERGRMSRSGNMVVGGKEA